MNYLFAYDLHVRTEGGTYDYNWPNLSDGSDLVDKLVHRLAETRPFRRLRDIRFLGALDYCLVAHPNGAKSNVRYTRAQHSLGVAALAKAYLEHVNHQPQDALACIAAAMLHDVGHAPFSHTLEPVLKKYFGIDHHQASERIILGLEYSTEVADVLSEAEIDPYHVVDILNGKDERFGGFFSGPINFDTIEGILRSRNYLRMQHLGLTPTRVLRAAVCRQSAQDEAIVDAFWACKDEVYNVVIRSKLGVVYDTIFQATAESCISEFDQSDFYLTETQAFRKHPALKKAAQARFWPEIIETLFPNELPYQTRRFYVDNEADFFAHQDTGRYRQHKLDTVLSREEVMRT